MKLMLRFEGEYSDRKFFKGKEYYYDNKIKYEGEYLNEKFWNGIEIKENSPLYLIKYTNGRKTKIKLLNNLKNNKIYKKKINKYKYKLIKNKYDLFL